jgi:hypothetical protein
MRNCDTYCVSVGGLKSRVTMQVMHAAVVLYASEMAKAMYIT